MCVVGIIGNGPGSSIPHLKAYEDEVDIWIGADRGALTLVNQGIKVDYALGDFDSVSVDEKATIIKQASHSDVHPSMKDETDLEIALSKAYDLNAKKIYLFGITGGRLDHALVNVQLLHQMIHQGVHGVIVDVWNKIEMKEPGTHTILKDDDYTYVSFVPFTEVVKSISLIDFAYPLENYDLHWGSTRLISNELLLNSGTLIFEEGLLLFIQSRDEGEVTK